MFRGTLVAMNIDAGATSTFGADDDASENASCPGLVEAALSVC